MNLVIAPYIPIQCLQVFQAMQEELNDENNRCGLYLDEIQVLHVTWGQSSKEYHVFEEIL